MRKLYQKALLNIKPLRMVQESEHRYFVEGQRLTGQGGKAFDVGSLYLKRLKNEQAASRIKTAPIALSNAKIYHDIKNNGAHIIVEGIDCFIDFWPSTGRWNTRFGYKGRGLYALLKYATFGGD